MSGLLGGRLVVFVRFFLGISSSFVLFMFIGIFFSARVERIFNGGLFKGRW